MLLFCLLKALTKDKAGVIFSLDDLDKFGKQFLYICIHLLLQDKSTEQSKNKNTYRTFQFLQNNENINVNQNEVISIISNFVDSGGYLFNKKKQKILESITDHIQSNKQNEKKEPEWLIFAKKSMW